MGFVKIVKIERPCGSGQARAAIASLSGSVRATAQTVWVFVRTVGIVVVTVVGTVQTVWVFVGTVGTVN